MSLDAFQSHIYEMTAFTGPTVSALLAGFAVVIFGELYLTDAGGRYLATLGRT